MDSEFCYNKLGKIKTTIEQKLQEKRYEDIKFFLNKIDARKEKEELLFSFLDKIFTETLPQLRAGGQCPRFWQEEKIAGCGMASCSIPTSASLPSCAWGWPIQKKDRQHPRILRQDHLQLQIAGQEQSHHPRRGIFREKGDADKDLGKGSG